MMTGTKSRLLVLSALAATVVALPASVAHADELTPCDLTVAPYKCSTLLIAAPFTKAIAGEVFSNKLDTGWFPKCPDPATDEHCDKNIQVRASSDFKDTKFSITMSADWVVKWGPDAAGLAKNSVRIGPRKKSPGGGDLKVTYKLRPLLSVYIGIAGFKTSFDFDPFDLLKAAKGDKIGLDTEFDYSASCSSKFELWAYDKPSAPCTMKDDTATGGELFSFAPLDLLPKGAQDKAKQFVGFAVTLNAGTNAGFTWQTKDITLEGASGPLNMTTDYIDLPYTGSSSIEVLAKAKGDIAYKGSTFIVPKVSITSIGGQAVNLSLPINAGKVEAPFDEKVPDQVIQTNLVFPVPNMKLTTTPVSFGSVKVGTKKLVPIKLANLGDAVSKVTVTSTLSAANFKVIKKDIDVPPLGEANIEVEFNPTDEGEVKGELLVVSNNIGGEDQKIPLSGKGTIDPVVEPEGGRGGMPSSGKGGSAGKPADPPEEEGGAAGAGGKKVKPTPDDASTEDGGCGCRVPAPSGDETPAGAIALAALALVAVRRRRALGLRLPRKKAAQNGYGWATIRTRFCVRDGDAPLPTPRESTHGMEQRSSEQHPDEISLPAGAGLLEDALQVCSRGVLGAPPRRGELREGLTLCQRGR